MCKPTARYIYTRYTRGIYCPEGRHTLFRNLRDGTVLRRYEGFPLERDHPVKGDLAEGHRRLLVLLGGGVDLAHLYRVQVGGVGTLPDEELAERGTVDVHERVAKHRLPQAVHDVVEVVARPGGSSGLWV
jgi:hypothetical protein